MGREDWYGFRPSGAFDWPTHSVPKNRLSQFWNLVDEKEFEPSASSFEVPGGTAHAEAIIRNIVPGEGMGVEFTRLGLKD